VESSNLGWISALLLISRLFGDGLAIYGRYRLILKLATILAAMITFGFVLTLAFTGQEIVNAWVLVGFTALLAIPAILERSKTRRSTAQDIPATAYESSEDFDPSIAEELVSTYSSMYCNAFFGTTTFLLVMITAATLLFSFSIERSADGLVLHIEWIGVVAAAVVLISAAATSFLGYSLSRWSYHTMLMLEAASDVLQGSATQLPERDPSNR